MNLRKKSGHNGKPNVACEILPDRIIAARASDDRGHIELATSRMLAAGVIIPSVAEPNLKNSGDLSHAISGALSATAGSRNRDVIAILPDAAARVSLLDFDAWPEKKQEAESVLRFRLKKALPFDAEKSALSYQAHRSGALVKVLAAVIPQEIISEYEAAFRDAGYFPGVVLPSSLAALGAVQAEEPTLLVKSDGATATISIVDADDLLLFRSLESVFSRSEGTQELADAVYASGIFFEDNYHSRVSRVFFSGIFPPDFAQRIESHTGVRPQELQVLAERGLLSLDGISKSLLAPVTGALLG